MKAKSILSAFAIIFAGLSFNAYLLFAGSYLFPQLISSDSIKQSSHQTIVKYILTNQKTSIEQDLTTDELNHITDVKNLVQKLPFITLPLIIFLFFLFKKLALNISQVTKYALIILIIILPLIFLFFIPFFNSFHQILFPEGNWSFSQESVLIQLYPENLWLSATVILITITIVELLTVLVSINKYGRRI